VDDEKQPDENICRTDSSVAGYYIISYNLQQLKCSLSHPKTYNSLEMYFSYKKNHLKQLVSTDKNLSFNVLFSGIVWYSCDFAFFRMMKIKLPIPVINSPPVIQNVTGHVSD